jgi:hypothetical protein
VEFGAVCGEELLVLVLVRTLDSSPVRLSPSPTRGSARTG